MAQFCTKCGARLNEGMRFCIACGAASGEPAAPAGQAPAGRAPVAPIAQPPAAAMFRPVPHAPAAAPRPAPIVPAVATVVQPPAVAPAPSRGSPILKIVLAVLGIMLVLVLVSVGAGVYYYYHHIKPKVTQIENTVRSFPIPTGTPQAPTQPAAPGGEGSSPGAAPSAASQNPAPPIDINKILQQIGKAAGPNNPLAKLAAMNNMPDPHFPALSPSDPSLYKGRLTFQPGMTLTQSISDPLSGDYDVLFSITSVSDTGVTSNISAQMPGNSQGTASPASAEVLKTHQIHTDSQQDLMHATGVFGYFSELLPESIPGVTLFLYSQDTMHALQSGSGIDLALALPVRVSSYVKMKEESANSGGGQGSPGDNDLWSKWPKYTCHEVRMEAPDAAFPILLNGQRVTLPAIHESCQQNGNSAPGYALDDDKFGLFLAEKNGQLTQINYPPETRGGGGQGIEQALKKEGKVDVYGIYFDFASDQLRPESAPVLAEIASALKDNPAWKLHVNGHTDNIGGDAYNLDLSNRRAAAVKQALVTQYNIDPARLDPQGFGATQPKESNDTVAGRARNRRVELIRE